MNRYALAILLAGASSIAACDDDDDPEPVIKDASTDASPLDAAKDAARDAVVDAARDAAIDAGADCPRECSAAFEDGKTCSSVTYADTRARWREESCPDSGMETGWGLSEGTCSDGKRYLGISSIYVGSKYFFNAAGTLVGLTMYSDEIDTSCDGTVLYGDALCPGEIRSTKNPCTTFP